MKEPDEEDKHLERFMRVSLYYSTYIGGYKMSTQTFHSDKLFFIENHWSDDPKDLGVVTTRIDSPLAGIRKEDHQRVQNAWFKNCLETFTDDRDDDSTPTQAMLRFAWANQPSKARKTTMEIIEHVVNRSFPITFKDTTAKNQTSHEKQDAEEENDNKKQKLN